jgi:hypothetical protein
MKGVKNMQCQEVQRKISAYLDGELDLAASRSLESHINDCTACKEIVADFRTIDALVRGLPKLEPDPDFAAQLLKKAGELGSIPAQETRSARSPFTPALRIISTFMDMLEERKAASTHILDEFGDFPPCSIGYIYLKLLGEPVRG